jgi:hypothetical protein
MWKKSTHLFKTSFIFKHPYSKNNISIVDNFLCTTLENALNHLWNFWFKVLEVGNVMDRLQTSGELQDKTSFIDPSTGVDLLKGCSPDYLLL